MMNFNRLVLFSCLTIFVTQSIWASNLKCVSLFSNSNPKGQLTNIQRTAGSSTGGKWVADENGINWFIKKDVHYPELQTSAEPIASQIYRHFGYNTPETHILNIDGVHYSASRDIGQNHSSTDLFDLNTAEVRQMRVVAAYLKDWDRLGNPSNNRLMSDGSLIILDFGGALGSRAQGRHKPGTVFSNAIGSFEATSDINTIYTTFSVVTTSKHPWMNINRSDAEAVIQKFKSLTDQKIETIVTSAQYSHKTDNDYMVQALKMRRDGIINNLLSLFQ